jgi:hypothetical protein
MPDISPIAALVEAELAKRATERRQEAAHNRQMILNGAERRFGEAIMGVYGKPEWATEVPGFRDDALLFPGVLHLQNQTIYSDLLGVLEYQDGAPQTAFWVTFAASEESAAHENEGAFRRRVGNASQYISALAEYLEEAAAFAARFEPAA